jgi:hypothetical protein
MLDKLIEEGELARKTCVSEGMYGEYLSGELFEKWVAKCIIFMENEHKGETIAKNFIEATKERNVSGKSISSYDTMIGILKALKEYDS